jgi:eukaryotic-like serine/threonine-protein kinase
LSKGLSDAAIARLRKVGSWPEFESGRYTALEELGRGGMGTVYLARDEALGREVAIKIPNALASTTLDRRLEIEARALAALEHPGIVPIHDAGRLADGRLFYVMKRVQGRTLRQYLVDEPDETARLRVFERMCEPVAFAHDRGVIHRDLKPENVMVGAFGEVVIMDWGGARANAPDPVGSGREAEDLVIGTVGFMAPEQSRGESIDHRVDVYGLGAMLFVMLTDDVPADDPPAALRRARAPKPLAAICAKALARDRSDRYATAAALGEEVARYRAGRAVAAYRESLLERIVRFERTYRTAILLVAGYIVMRVLVALLAGW